MIFLSEAVWILALAIFVGVPSWAWHVRGRRYSIFGMVVLLVSLPGAVVMHGRMLGWFDPALRPWLDAAFLYCLLATGVHLIALVRARLRGAFFRWGISVAGQAFLAAGALSTVWLLALAPIRGLLWGGGFEGALSALEWLDLLPFVVAGISVVTSSRPVEEIVRVRLGTEGPSEVTRVPVERYRRRRRPAPLEKRPLRVVQVSDPHLGPWQPIRKLQRHLADLVAHDPDLILLTGDFLTMEGRGSPGSLAQALEPLRAAEGRAFAIFGNHDHEALDEVRAALEWNKIDLLVDEERLIETAVGTVQIVGADYVRRERAEHIRELLERFPRRQGVLRLFLLHDPIGFRFVPKGDVDLTLSGHTHGGQLGLVSFGLDWTVLSRSPWPDHGLFGHGTNRLYVHRGTGFYGFPLRIGVPGEASLLELVLP